jgi:hypothetical protein
VAQYFYEHVFKIHIVDRAWFMINVRDNHIF